MRLITHVVLLLTISIVAACGGGDGNNNNHANSPSKTPEPEVLGSALILKNPIAVKVSGNYAYIGNGSGGFQVVDISDATQPRLAARLDVNTFAGVLAIRGDYAYLASQDAAHNGVFVVVDISNPESPILVGEVTVPDIVVGIALTGNYAYVANNVEGMRVIDITNPANPTVAAVIDTPTDTEAVVISGQMAYVAAGHFIQIFDIAAPMQPQLLGAVQLNQRAFDLAVSNGYVYANGLGFYLSIIDATNPIQPVVRAVMDIAANDVEVLDQYVLVPTLDALEVVDVSNKAAPEIVETLMLEMCVDALDISDSTVLLTGCQDDFDADAGSFYVIGI